MKIPFVDLHAQYLSIKSAVDAAIAEVISDSAFIRGPQVDAFEQAWADTLGIKPASRAPTGPTRSTLPCGAWVSGLGMKSSPTAHSWISTSETITQAGARVVFSDTDYDTFTIDTGLIEEKITSRTVGIIPVHLYGQACDMDAIMSDRRKH